MKRTCCVWVLVLLILPSGHRADELATLTGAKKVIERFCSAELGGDRTIRVDLVRYSPERRAREHQGGHDADGLLVSFTNDALCVASAFRVEKVTLRGNRAVASVAFAQIASSEGDGEEKRTLRKDCRPHDVVEYSLVFARHRWWILDPPQPRVSREALVKGYQESLRFATAEWFELPDVTADQKRSERKKLNELAFLQGLSSQCSREGSPDRP